MASTTITKIKLALRISHDKLDEDIQADIYACLADLKVCGIHDPNESDPLIFNAIKLFCRSAYVDDPAKCLAYLERYNALKSCLMMAEGYGLEAGSDD